MFSNNLIKNFIELKNKFFFTLLDNFHWWFSCELLYESGRSVPTKVMWLYNTERTNFLKEKELQLNEECLFANSKRKEKNEKLNIRKLKNYIQEIVKKKKYNFIRIFFRFSKTISGKRKYCCDLLFILILNRILRVTIFRNIAK